MVGLFWFTAMADDFNPTEWITTAEAAELTGYSVQYLRRIIRQGRVRARKWVNAWMVDRKALLDYKREMDSLGPEKHDPWRIGARCKSNGVN